MIVQAKAIGTSGYAGHFSGYDEYVPMVDKAVDSGWKKQTPPPKLSVSKGLSLLVLIAMESIYNILNLNQVTVFLVDAAAI